jgi:hypothetical protein
MFLMAYFETRTGLGLGHGLGLEENPDSRKPGLEKNPEKKKKSRENPDSCLTKPGLDF